jgi:hypothetical protein
MPYVIHISSSSDQLSNSAMHFYAAMYGVRSAAIEFRAANNAVLRGVHADGDIVAAVYNDPDIKITGSGSLPSNSSSPK